MRTYYRCYKYPTKNILTKGIWLNVLFTDGSPIQNVKIILVGYLDHPNVKIGDTAIQREAVYKIPMPSNFGDKEIAVLKKDFELLLQKIEGSPKEICSLVEAAAAGDAVTARPLAKRLGLSEEAFQEQGGGWIGVAIALGVLLWSTDAH